MKGEANLVKNKIAWLQNQKWSTSGTEKANKKSLFNYRSIVKEQQSNNWYTVFKLDLFIWYAHIANNLLALLTINNKCFNFFLRNL